MPPEFTKKKRFKNKYIQKNIWDKKNSVMSEYLTKYLLTANGKHIFNGKHMIKKFLRKFGIVFEFGSEGEFPKN